MSNNIDAIALKKFYEAIESIKIQKLKDAPHEHAHEICAYWRGKSMRLEKQVCDQEIEILRLNKLLEEKSAPS